MGMRGSSTTSFTGNFNFGFFGVGSSYPEKPKVKIARVEASVRNHLIHTIVRPFARMIYCDASFSAMCD